MNSKYAVIIYGATGFTGKLAAEYLAKRLPTANLTREQVAIAGRNKSKLESISKSLAAKFLTEERDADALYFDVIEADSANLVSIEEMVKQAKVVLSTVGPYAKYGTPVVAACVKHGVHYCDITGETSWNRRIIDQYEAEAKQTGSKIVSFCGHDSVPYDIGVLYLVDYVRKNFDCGIGAVQTIVESKGGQISGGTFQTIMTSYENPDAVADADDEFLLNPRDDKEFPPRTKPRSAEKSRSSLWQDPERGWLSPAPMSRVNSRVIRRSWRLYEKEGGYGKNFLYKPEGQVHDGLASAVVTSAVMSMDFSLKVPFIRSTLQKYGLQSGDGPSEEKRKTVKSWIRIIGEVDNPVTDEAKRDTNEEGANDAKTTSIRAYVDIHAGDLGYSQTAEMVVESALMLAFDETRPEVGGGIWTPAYVFGTKLADKLNEFTEIKFSANQFTAELA